MSEAQLLLQDRTLVEILGIANSVKTGVTDNAATFPTPNPTMAALTANITAGQAAQAAYDLAIEATRLRAAERRDAQADLVKTLTGLVSYVQNVSGGDETIILSANMQVRKTPEPVGELPAPKRLQARNNGQPTTVVLKWGAVYGSRYYIVELAKSLNGVITEPFHAVDQPTRASAEVTELLAATEYQFRIRAVGTAGPGPWSDIVTKVTGA